MHTKLATSPLLNRLCAVAAMRKGDAIDYRAMRDREYQRVGWHGDLVTPARALRGESAASVLLGGR